MVQGMSNPALTNYVNGIGQVTSDGLNTFMQVCTNMAQLRAFAGNNSALSVYVKGTTSANDGGQGTFYWNSSVIGTDDNGVTTVVPNGVAIGCWTRQSTVVTLLATSTTSNTIGTGSKTFIISQTGVTLGAGTFVVIASRANVANYMHGQIISNSANTLVVNSIDTGGSGTYTDWNILLSGSQGSSGANPAFNTILNGTNTSAAMIVGTGSSLTTSGTGSIVATSVASATTNVNVSAATAPTNGQMLTATSSTTATWQTPVPGALVLLSTQTASTSANLQFTTGINNIYSKYIFEFLDLIFSGDTNFVVNTSSNGGSSYDSGATDYSYTFRQYKGVSGTAFDSGSNVVNISRILLNSSTLNSSQPMNGSFILYNPSQSVVNHMVSWEFFNLVTSGSVPCIWEGVGYRNSSISVNAIKFAPGGGTITSGAIKLYGLS